MGCAGGNRRNGPGGAVRPRVRGIPLLPELRFVLVEVVWGARWPI